LYATNDQAFVNIMMLEELGLVVDDSSPFWGGVVTFFAFAIFGLLPLIPFIIGASDKTQYTYWAIIIGILELFSLGYAKAVLVGLNRYISGLESLLLGGFAVGVGYLIGLAFNTN
jgi:VIT1/CCC1 family predicted Fe2+/Mn2+ transporter